MPLLLLFVSEFLRAFLLNLSLTKYGLTFDFFSAYHARMCRKLSLQFKPCQREKMRYRAALTLLIPMMLFACATPPAKESVVTPEYQSRIDLIEKVAIIADVGIRQDVLGDNDYYVIQDARTAEQHLLDAARAFLEGKGYKVSYVQAPFVGAFLGRDMPVKVCCTGEGELTEKNPPLFESEGMSGNPIYREALLTIIPSIAESSNPSPDPADVKRKGLMDIVARNTGADATLFLVVNGTIVSTGKQFTQGLTTTVVSTVMTLGWGAFCQYDKSVLDTFAALIDNNTGEILWSTSIRLTGGELSEKSSYGAESWPKIILDQLPFKAAGKRADAPTVVHPTASKR